MTEVEKIAYAKSFIDKLANGINPLDDTPVPEGDIVNNVRISRCLFYVSDILGEAIKKEGKKKAKEERKARLPFSVTQEQLQNFEYSSYPISATAIAKKLNVLVQEDIASNKIERMTARRITQWFLNIGMIEWREWENKIKRFPTEEGEKIGLDLQIWENYGRRSPVIFYNEDAQRFITDNIGAIAATVTKKGKDSPVFFEDEEEDSE